jgi:PEP-CTERM motif
LISTGRQEEDVRAVRIPPAFFPGKGRIMLSSISKSLRSTVIGVAALLVTTAPASAAIIGVTYNMNYSFLAPAAGVPTLYGPGTLTAWFVNGTSGTMTPHVSPGPNPITWVSGTAMLMGTFSAAGGLVMITGFQNVQFSGGMGLATAGGMFNLGTIGHITAGMLHCSGGFCGAAMFVTSVPVALTSGPRTVVLNGLLLNGFPSFGPQTFMGVGTGGMTPNGGVFQVTVSGQEVSRQVVPEPGTGALLGLGLAGLGIAVTTIRRWGRS